MESPREIGVRRVSTLRPFVAQPRTQSRASVRVCATQSHGTLTPMSGLHTPCATSRTANQAPQEDETVEKADIVPAGFRSYETLVVLKPTLSETELHQELKEFELFLAEQGCTSVTRDLRIDQPLAYTVKRFDTGTFALYTYAAPPASAPAIVKFLSKPVAGKEAHILRHTTYKL